MNRKKCFATLLAISSVEFFIAGALTLKQKSEAGSAIFFGFSVSRLMLFIGLLVIGSFLLILAKEKNLKKHWENIDKQFLQFKNGWLILSISLFILGLFSFFSSESGTFLNNEYYTRMRFALIVFCIVPLQLAIAWIRTGFFNKRKVKVTLSLIIFLILLLLIATIYFSKYGITPDVKYWNVVGMPITSLQLLLIFLISFLIAYVLKWLIKSKHIIKISNIDIFIAVLLFASAIMIWQSTPMLKHFFSKQPLLPEYQAYPYSDARTYDMGALSIVDGQGINFEKTTDKPLYIAFLGFLHLVSGDDYEMLVNFQIIIIAVLVPILYLFANEFSGRIVGLVIALIVIARQRNAILLSYKVANVNPKLLMTEIPTMLGIMIVVWLLFRWAKNNQSGYIFALLTGLAVGTLGLIRSNPLIFIITIPLFMIIIMWKTKKLWLRQSFVFLVGAILMISPWLYIGRSEDGQIYFFERFKKILQNRYDQSYKVNNFQFSEKKENNNFRNAKPIESINFQDLNSASFDIGGFPEFVINHTLHNLIASLYSMPDTLEWGDQELFTLAERNYWQESNNAVWGGEIAFSQIPLIIFNVWMISIGIGEAVKKKGIIGLIPLLIFFAYCVALGFARTSGSRYTLPVDWVVYLYLTIGLVRSGQNKLMCFFGSIDEEGLDNQEQRAGFYSNRRIEKTFLVIFSLTFLLIPAMAIYQPKLGGQCQREDIHPSLIAANQKEAHQGKVIYPYYSQGTTSFVLFGCREAFTFEVQSKLDLGFGDSVIVFSNNPPQTSIGNHVRKINLENIILLDD